MGVYTDKEEITFYYLPSHSMFTYGADGESTFGGNYIFVDSNVSDIASSFFLGRQCFVIYLFTIRVQPIDVQKR